MRGIFERPKGSAVWWISYFDGTGKHHREKIGRRSDAIAAYQDRKADVRAGRKLPSLRRTKAITLSDLIDLALEFTEDHADRRSYVGKVAVVRKDLGHRPAEEITPQEIDRWISSRKKSPATANRYKSFISLCFREGIRNRKASANPARLVRQRKEPLGRLRFLTRAEYAALLAQVPEEHRPSLALSVHTGMRQTEQFTLTWDQVHLDRHTIELTNTKNGAHRMVRLNADSVQALLTLQRGKHSPKDRLYPGAVRADLYGTRSWFPEALRAAGIADYTWHSNRHTFCSWLAMAGATIRDIQELAGHKTIAMSARYAHLSPQHTLSVIDRIAGSAN